MLKRVAAECRRRWEVKATRADHFTFDDLLHTMRSALNQPLFMEKVRAKYKAVIVDEFQDTDPIQWSIFEKLFLKSHLLYLVGDPKQSIYGFRSADIYTYMRAADALGKENKAFLDTNYRSSPQLIDALNALFTKNPDWIVLPALPDALEYHPVKAGRSENVLKEEPITYFGVQGDPSKEKSWPTKVMEEEKLFPYIASEMIRLRAKIPFSEMAVLVKDRFQAQRLQLHLNRWNIPSNLKRMLHLAKSRGFVAMEMLLKALAHPENDRYVRAALFGPLMEREENPFFALKEIFLEKGFAPFYEHFISHHFTAHDFSLFFAIAPDGGDFDAGAWRFYVRTFAPHARAQGRRSRS